MSRDDGFPVADMDSAYFEDSKMRDLWQRVRDADLMARAVVLHAATLLGSWRQGERITVGQATPLWMVADEAVVDHLKAVKLLDKTGKIPAPSWSKWFGPAFSRREARREAGRIGGQAKPKHPSSDASPTLTPPGKPNSSPTEPVRPSVPSVLPSVHPPRARGERDGQTNGRSPVLIDEQTMTLEERSARYIERQERLTGVKA